MARTSTRSRRVNVEWLRFLEERVQGYAAREVLAWLARTPHTAYSLGELARVLRRSPGTLAYVMPRLVAEGLVTPVSTPHGVRYRLGSSPDARRWGPQLALALRPVPVPVYGQDPSPTPVEG